MINEHCSAQKNPKGMHTGRVRGLSDTNPRARGETAKAGLHTQAFLEQIC